MARTRSSVWVIEFRMYGRWHPSTLSGYYATRAAAEYQVIQLWQARKTDKYRVWRYEAVPDRSPERKGA